MSALSSDKTLATGISEHQIDLIVNQLRRVCRQATMEYALNVGRIIIHNFYDGDISAWRGRGPKLASFRRLASRPDLPMSPVLLYRCVATYELCERVDALSRWGNINVSHIRAVLNLPDDLQVDLLSRANAERWPVRRLEELASAARGSRQHRHSSHRPLVRAVAALSRALSDEVGQHSLLMEADAANVRRVLDRARKALQELEEALGSAAPSDEPPPRAARAVTPSGAAPKSWFDTPGQESIDTVPRS